jgi:uncharacterized protein YjbI with pentapeptide repeats
MTGSERPNRLATWREYIAARVQARRERAAVRATLLKPISTWIVVLSVITVVAATWPLTQWLYAIAGDDPARKIDAVRTGLTVAAGTGGAFALLLAFRRQRATEIIAAENRAASERDHVQRERLALANEADAIERRVTDQYTNAAEQLGSDKAAVRLAGLYAMERLAQDIFSQRQTVVNLICAYLRMPFVPPINEPTATETDENERRIQELEVRLAAEDILQRHLQIDEDSGVTVTHWPSMLLNLTGATLVNFSLMKCEVKSAIFNRAIFHGPAYFYDFTATGRVQFQGANFLDRANFGRAYFPHLTNFWAARFHEMPNFQNSVFNGQAHFKDAAFDKGVDFSARVRRQFAENETLSTWPPGCLVTAIDDVWVMLRRLDDGIPE